MLQPPKISWNWLGPAQGAREHKTRARASTGPTLVPFNLRARNVPGPLAFRIWNYMHLSWNLTASHENRSTGSRDIFMFVKYFPENPPSHFRFDLPWLCFIKYCLSICTSHVWYLFFHLGSKTREGLGPGNAAQHRNALIFTYQSR